MGGWMDGCVSATVSKYCEETKEPVIIILNLILTLQTSYLSYENAISLKPISIKPATGIYTVVLRSPVFGVVKPLSAFLLAEIMVYFKIIPDL